MRLQVEGMLATHRWGLIGLVVMLLAKGEAMACSAAGDVLERTWQGSFSTGSTADGSLKLFDWNIQRGLQLERIVEAIERARPDICVFQEVDLNARRTNRLNIAEELGRKFRLNYVFGVEFQELSQGSRSSAAYHGQAVLTSLPIRSHRILRFVHQSDHWSPRWYLPNWPLFQARLGGRMAFVVEVEVGGAVLVLYNVHLEGRGSERRRLLQLEEILSDAERYRPETPIVLAGDLNTKSRPSPLIHRLKQAGFRDAIGQRPVPTASRGRSVDWIFVRGPLTSGRGRVHHEIIASDHFPLSVHLSLAGSPVRTPR